MQENHPNNTDEAARLAVTEQQHGDEFKAQESPDARSLVNELNTIDNEVSELTQKMYGTFMGQMDGSFKQPPYLERERMRLALEEKETRGWQIRQQLNVIAAQMGPLE